MPIFQQVPVIAVPIGSKIPMGCQSRFPFYPLRNKKCLSVCRFLIFRKTSGKRLLRTISFAGRIFRGFMLLPLTFSFKYGITLSSKILFDLLNTGIKPLASSSERSAGFLARMIVVFSQDFQLGPRQSFKIFPPWW